MLVIVPTYKRLEALNWVLISLVNSDLPKLDTKPRVVVINNYPLAKNDIGDIVERIKIEHREKASQWDWAIISREKTLPPIENWYSDLDKLAKPSEIVFFLGDDDPLTKWSIKRRYETLTNNDADFIAGRLCSGLYFYKRCAYVYFEGNLPIYKHTTPELIDSENIWDWTTIHVSNHCFKYNEGFKSALKLAYTWTDSQEGISPNYRTLFMPFYIALALLKSGRKLIGIDETIVFRGQTVEEIRGTHKGSQVYNLAFMSLLCYDIIHNSFPNDAKTNRVKNIMLNEFKKRYVTIIFDKILEKSEKKYLLNKYKNITSTMSINDWLFGLLVQIKHALKLNGLLLRFKAGIQSVSANTFFERL